MSVPTDRWCDVQGSVSLSGKLCGCNGVRYNGLNYEEVDHTYWGVSSGHFINWMHIAGLSNFHKLWGKGKALVGDSQNKESAFKKGARFRITIYSTFKLPQNVRKSVVISTKSRWLGGKNSPLAYAYIVSAVISLSVALFFTYCYVWYARKIGDVGDLNKAWTRSKPKSVKDRD